MRIVLYSKDLRHMADLSFGLQQQEHAATVVSATELTLVSASRIAQTFLPDCALIVLPDVFNQEQLASACNKIDLYFGGLTLLFRETSEPISPRLTRQGGSRSIYWFEAAHQELSDATWIGSALCTARIHTFDAMQGPFNVPLPEKEKLRRAAHKKGSGALPKTDGRGHGSKRWIQIVIGDISLQLLPEQCCMLAWFIVHVGQKFTAADITEELGRRRIVRCSPHSVTHSIIPLKNKMDRAGIGLIHMKRGYFSFVDRDDWAARIRAALEKIDFCQPILALGE